MESFEPAGCSGSTPVAAAERLTELLLAYTRLNTVIDPPGYRAELAQEAAHATQDADPAVRLRLERRAEILQFFHERYEAQVRARTGRNYGYQY